MDGKLLKSLKIADEKKAEENKQDGVNLPDGNDKEEPETKEDEKEVFTKKEETAFKLVDKTTDEEKPSTAPVTTDSKKKQKEEEELAIKVAKELFYGDEGEPEDTNYYFSLLRRESDNILIIEVRDKKTTRTIITYKVNVHKKEIEEIV